MKIILYGTVGCHLCDEAQEMIEGCRLYSSITLETVDISEHDDLYELYSLRIPVAERADTKNLLYWPFTQEEVERFIT